ncbi:CPBP family intramembrane glutamic endopeptidase [Flavobacterium frigoris]|uniref:Abortive infection protein n=1 Tax=Flavobacterium frigoris (strain PS1) TaxID=1086011 RepID=H7FRF7_FLAFP|nr:type II CAAX endopeptidase family protein [Flavobacterium frigoris]EIA08940.1 abortive infection protein [Flavobacterium frigoris PS1]
MNDYLKKTKKSTLIGGISFLVLLLIATAVSFPFLKQLNFKYVTTFYISRLIIWLCLFLVYMYSVTIEKQNFLLWKEKKYSLLFYIQSIAKTMGILVLVMLGIALLFKLSGSNIESKKIDEILKFFNNNLPLILFTSITAGVTEELLFRGYLIPRLEILFKNSYWAIVISSVLFGLIHYSYGTLIQIIAPLFIGVVLAFHYQKYRSITIIIICHFLWDLIVLLNKTSQMQ